MAVSRKNRTYFALYNSVPLASPFPGGFFHEISCIFFAFSTNNVNQKPGFGREISAGGNSCSAETDASTVLGGFFVTLGCVGKGGPGGKRIVLGSFVTL